MKAITMMALIVSLVAVAWIASCQPAAETRESKVEVLTLSECKGRQIYATDHGGAVQLSFVHLQTGTAPLLRFRRDGSLHLDIGQLVRDGDPSLVRVGQRVCAAGDVREGDACVVQWWLAQSCIDIQDLAQ